MSEAQGCFRAASTDEMQFLIRDVADQQVHGVLRFDGHLDVARLERAVRLTLDAEPVLGCRWEVGRRKCLWRRRGDLDAIAHVEVCAAAGADDPWSFVVTPVEPGKDPAVQVRIFRAAGSDTLCVKLDHVATDAGGARQYLHLLADTYRRLATEPGHRPPRSPIGNRSVWQVLRRNGPLALLRAYRRRPGRVPDLSFPVAGSGAERTMVVRRLTPELTSVARRFGKAQGATLNDVVVAACYRALFSLSPPRPGEPLHVQVPVDLRRYLPAGRRTIGNLSGMIRAEVVSRPDQGFEDVLQQVHASLGRAKSDRPGLDSAITAALAGLMGFERMKAILAPMLARGRQTGRSPPLVTNLGALDEEQLRFEGVELADALLVGPVLHPPGFALAFSTFRGALTLTVGTSGGREQVALVERCLDAIVRELGALGGGPIAAPGSRVG